MKFVIDKGEHKQLFLLNQTVDIQVIQGADSVVDIYLFFLDTKSSINSVTVEQIGENASTNINGLVIGSEKQTVQVSTHINHRVGQGKSNQLLKFILADQAKGFFCGELRIEPNAQKVEAHQTNRNLVLSDKAQMRTMPQLEIYADDVKASHGASTGQLDESALFYMQQRGISVSKARQLLIQSFANETLAGLSEEQTQKIGELIETRLSEII